LLTRTLASPAWVSQTPVASPPPCACAAGAPGNAAKIAKIAKTANFATMVPNRQDMDLSLESGPA
jgi:hypothetical protein